MSDTPVLTSERLVLRPLVATDAAALHDLYADAGLMRYWSHAPHTSFYETRRKVAGIVADRAWRNWAITRHGNDRAIGTLATHENRQGRVIEIGYALTRAHLGKGYAREAVTRLLDRLFGEEGVRRVFADTDPDNAASNRLVQSLGFVCEGRLRGEWETHIGVRDSFIWGLLASEWMR